MKYSILIVIIVAAAILTILSIGRDKNLMEVGDCVETMAGIEKFDGTAQEKWDLFAVYCAKQTK